MELVGFLATIVVAAALPYTYKMDGHVGWKSWSGCCQKDSGRNRYFTRTLTLILFILITWQMFLYAEDIYQTGEVSMNLEFPIYYIVYLLSFGLLVFTITILEAIVQDITKLRKMSQK